MGVEENSEAVVVVGFIVNPQNKYYSNSVIHKVSGHNSNTIIFNITNFLLRAYCTQHLSSR